MDVPRYPGYPGFPWATMISMDIKGFPQIFIDFLGCQARVSGGVEGGPLVNRNPRLALYVLYEVVKQRRSLFFVPGGNVGWGLFRIL